MDIVLDTNILRSDIQLRSSQFKVILDYLGKTSGRIFLPRVVFDEVINIYHKELEVRAGKARNAAKHFNLAVMQESNRISIPSLDVDAEIELYKKHLIERLGLADNQFLEPKNEFLPVIVQRAIKDTRPFRGHDQGFRDTVIWLTILDHCKSSSKKQIVFLTANAGDFSDPENNQNLHADLLRECEEAKVKIHFFKSIAEFIDKHSTAIAYITDDWIIEKLGDYDVQPAFEEALYKFRVKYFLEEFANEHGVSVSDDYTVLYTEDYDLTKFSVYEVDHSEYILKVDFQFSAGIEFNWEGQSIYGWEAGGSGTVTEGFKFDAELSVSIKDKEIVEVEFTFLQ